MPDIVYVDDDPSEFMALATKAQRARIEPFGYSPDDPASDALDAAAKANLWLFDFFLVAGPESEDADEDNGLSLFQKWRRSTAQGRPVTVVVSSDLGKAIHAPLVRLERRHVVAQQLGVEWIGDKTEETLRQVVELADAVQTVVDGLKLIAAADGRPSSYEDESLCFDVLGAPKDVAWANSVRREVDRARPPREVPTSGPATGRAIVGWLLSHVLPYPSFLLTDAQAALRLRIAPASMRALADSVGNDRRAKRRRSFAEVRYTGPLAAFAGRRWWRAGIDDFAWELSQAKESYRQALQAIAPKVPITWLEQEEPVLLFDDDLVETDDVAEASVSVRVTDEDFPANVEPAWVSLEAARENRLLASKVVFEDRELLGARE